MIPFYYVGSAHRKRERVILLARHSVINEVFVTRSSSFNNKLRSFTANNVHTVNTFTGAVYMYMQLFMSEPFSIRLRSIISESNRITEIFFFRYIERGVRAAGSEIIIFGTIRRTNLR